MATTIRIGVDNGAIGTIDEIRQRAKQLSSDLKSVQREIQDTSRMTGTVSKELTDRYKAIRQQYDNTKEMAKEQAKLEKRMEDANRNFSRGDVRKVRALTELAEGNVSAHSIRHATELLAETDLGKRLGLGKFADTLGNISGPLMVAQMVEKYVEEQYKLGTEQIKQDAEIQSHAIDRARELGMSGNVRKEIAERVARQSYLKRASRGELTEYEEAQRQRAMGNEALDLSEGKEDLENQRKAAEAAEKRMGEINEARKFKQEFGISNAAIVKRAIANIAATGKDRNVTTADWNEALDQILAERLETNEGQRVLSDHTERERVAHEKDLQENRRMAADPIYAAARKFQLHEEKMQAEIDFQVRHKRYANPNPVDF